MIAWICYQNFDVFLFDLRLGRPNQNYTSLLLQVHDPFVYRC
jgi:hypothetical protein